MRVLVVICLCAVAAGAALAGTVTVGGREYERHLPFGNYHYAHVFTQGLVLASDGLYAGWVKKWEWEVWRNSKSINPYGNWTGFFLRCCHTPYTKLTWDPVANYGGHIPVTVYGPRNAPLITDGIWGRWVIFTFDKPFYYDGRNNLIIEVFWHFSAGGVFAVTWYKEEEGRSVEYYQYRYWSKGRLCPVRGRRDVFHSQRITITPVGKTDGSTRLTSLGRVKAMYR